MTTADDIAGRVRLLLEDLDAGRLPAELAERLAGASAWLSFAAAARQVGVAAAVIRQRADRRSAPLPTRWCGPCRRVRLVDVQAEFRARPVRDSRKTLPSGGIGGRPDAEGVEGTP